MNSSSFRNMVTVPVINVYLSYQYPLPFKDKCTEASVSKINNRGTCQSFLEILYLSRPGSKYLFPFQSHSDISLVHLEIYN